MKKTILLIICLVSIGGITLSIKSNKTKTLDTTSIAKYKDTMAIYVESKDGGYQKSENIPTSSSYVLSSKSKCSNGAKPTYTNNKLKLSNLTKNDTSCYLYFDLSESGKVLNQLGLTSNGEVKEFTGTSCENNCPLSQNGVYEAEDDFGTSYYYRGTVDNNWVVFGKDTSDENKYIWWRIIRVNGNGTIRLIYAGTSSSTSQTPETTGNGTMIKPQTYINNTEEYKMAVYFNQNYGSNTYVGYMTGATGQNTFEKTHTNANNSTVLDTIKYWYENRTNLSGLANDYLDVDTGFCGDRQVTTAVPGYTGQGISTQETAYASLERLYNGSWKKTQFPTLKCGYNSDNSTDEAARKRDLYTGPNARAIKGSNGNNIEGNNKLPVPVGLITVDEVIYAGGFGGTANNAYWLYTNRFYWTMSPYWFSSSRAAMFSVRDTGVILGNETGSDVLGARPVVNLKANVKITGTGVDGDPYIVEGAV